MASELTRANSNGFSGSPAKPEKLIIDTDPGIGMILLLQLLLLLIISFLFDLMVVILHLSSLHNLMAGFAFSYMD